MLCVLPPGLAHQRPRILQAIEAAGLPVPIVAVDFSERLDGNFTNHGSSGGVFVKEGLPSYSQDYGDSKESGCIAFDDGYTVDAINGESTALGDVAAVSLAVYAEFSATASAGTRNIVCKGNATALGWEIRILADGRVVPQVNDGGTLDAHTFSGDHHTATPEWCGFCRDLNDTTFTASTSINSEQSEVLDSVGTLVNANVIEFGDGVLRAGFGDGTGLGRYLIMWSGADAEGIRRADFIALAAALDAAATPNRRGAIFIGDSTVHNASAGEQGWADYFTPYLWKVMFANRASSGASSLTFEGRSEWTEAQPMLKAGRYLFIQFGHNDGGDTTPGVSPNWLGTYRDQLEVYIDAAEAAGAIPVLVTSVARMIFDSEYVTTDTHGEYPPSMRKLAADRGITLLDLEARSRADYEAIGETATIVAYSYDDTTHFSPGGAALIAAAVADLAKASGDETLAAMFV